MGRIQPCSLASLCWLFQGTACPAFALRKGRRYMLGPGPKSCSPSPTALLWEKGAYQGRQFLPSGPWKVPDRAAITEPLPRGHGRATAGWTCFELGQGQAGSSSAQLSP